MKKLLCIFLVLLLLFAGCTKADSNDPDIRPKHIKSNILKGMMSPNAFFFKNNIFLLNENEKNSTLALITTDGKKLSSRKIIGTGLRAFIGDENIAILDKNENLLYILDEKLETINEYQVNVRDAADISPDFKTLYTFDYYNGIYKIDIASSKEELIYKCNSVHITTDTTKTHTSFSFYDENTSSNKTLLLNKNTGEIMENDANLLFYVKNGNTYIKKDGKTYLTNITLSTTYLTEDSKYLYYYNYYDNNVYVYNMDFTLASYCKFPRTSPGRVGDIIYNEENETFLVELTNRLDKSEFYFWEPDFSLTGSDLWVLEQKPPPKLEHIAKEELYEKSDEIKQKYGVEVLIAEEAKHAYGDRSSKILTDESLITSAISKIDEALSMYPIELLEQTSGFKIELVKDLNNYKDNMDYDSRGFYYNAAIIDAEKIDDEIIHLLLNKYFSILFREDLLHPRENGFKNDEWEKLLPSGFHYVVGDSKELINETYTDANKEYFISKTGVKRQEDDISEILANAVLGNSEIFENNEKLQNKLSYLKECIEEMYNVDTSFLEF